MGSLGRKATEDFKVILECQAKMENLEPLDNQAPKETAVFLELLEVWDHRARKAAWERWESQVRLAQRVPKETVVYQDILDSEGQMDKKETLEYLVSQESVSQDLLEKRV